MAYGTNGTDSATNHMLYIGTYPPLLYWTCAFSEVDVKLQQTVFRETVYCRVYVIIIILADLLHFLIMKDNEMHYFSNLFDKVFI
jgi:sulfite exporter TauE/SafE